MRRPGKRQEGSGNRCRNKSEQVRRTQTHLYSRSDETAGQGPVPPHGPASAKEIPKTSQINNLNLLYLNPRSINGEEKPKKTELLADSKLCDFVFLCESWFVEGQKSPFKHFDLLHSNVRSDTLLGRGGGLAIFRRSGVTSKFELIKTKEPALGVQVVEMLINGLRFYLLYRSPSIKPEEDEKFIKFLEKEQLSECYVIGDANLDTVKWNDPPKSSNARHLKIANILYDNGLKNVIHQSTHIKGNILDIVCVPRHSYMNYASVLEEYEVADHYPILLNFPANLPERALQRTLQQFQNINKAHYQDLLTFHKRSFDFDPDIDLWANEIAEEIAIYRNAVIPKKVISCVGQYGGHSFKVRKLFEDVAFLKRKGDMVAAQQAKIELESLLRAEKQKENEKFLKYLAANRNNLYKVKKKATFRQEITSIKLENGTFSSDPKEMAECLSRFYKSVLQVEAPESYDEHPDPFDFQGMLISDIDISENLVKKTIKRFKKSDNPGSDGVSVNALKDGVDQLSLPLSQLFRRSIEDSKVPGSWKRTRIEPLPKSQDSKDPNKTRPINKSSPIAKILEKIVSDQIFAILEANNFFHRSQYGFRKRMSTVDNLLAFTAKLVEGLATSNFHVVTFDFAKAFDKVPHSILLKKLWLAGIRGKLFLWIKDWLKWRSQFVHMQDYDSADVHTSSSVVQGSCIGVCLFLIFVNDLPREVFEVIVSLFADDLKLGKKIESAEDCVRVQRAIDSAYNWSLENKMEFNSKKCSVLYYGDEKHRQIYTIGGEIITPTEDFVDLGVNFNTKKGFACHIDHITNKANVAATAMKRNFKCMSWNSKVQAYQSYVAPLVEYAAPVWAPKSNFKKLNAVYRTYFAGCKPPSEAKMPWTPEQRCLLFEMIAYKKQIERYKQLGLDPPNLVVPVHRYPTRQQRLSCIRKQPKLLSDLLSRRLDVWERIPGEIRDGSMTRYKSHLLEQVLPSCESEILRSRLQIGRLFSKAQIVQRLAQDGQF